MISQRFSVYLDGVRGFAALTVLLFHLAYPRFTGGSYMIIRDLNLGSDAVILFFVLSGLVIAFTVDKNPVGFGHYAFQRATRLYSVAIPAVFLTLLLDRVGAGLNPEAYDGWWYNPASVFQYLFFGLTFSNEWGPFSLRLGTNGPYWSLSYEAAYYILFGLAFFLKGFRRIILISLGLFIFGLKALVLMPSWLFGVLVYRLLKAEIKIPQKILWCLFGGPILIYVLLLAINVPGFLLDLSTSFLGADRVEGLRFSDEFIWNGLIGFLFAAHIFAAGVLLKDREWRGKLAKGVRWLAGASFSIYVVHYPALMFFDGVLPEFSFPLLRDVILLGLTLVLAFLFARFFERPLGAFRRGTKALFSKI